MSNAHGWIAPGYLSPADWTANQITFPTTGGNSATITRTGAYFAAQADLDVISAQADTANIALIFTVNPPMGYVYGPGPNAQSLYPTPGLIAAMESAAATSAAAAAAAAASAIAASNATVAGYVTGVGATKTAIDAEIASVGASLFGARPLAEFYPMTYGDKTASFTNVNLCIADILQNHNGIGKIILAGSLNWTADVTLNLSDIHAQWDISNGPSIHIEGYGHLLTTVTATAGLAASGFGFMELIGSNALKISGMTCVTGSNTLQYGILTGRSTGIVAQLSNPLSTGAPITALPVTTTIPQALPPGTLILLTDNAGHTQTFTSSAGIAAGAASIPVNSLTPNFAYPASTTNVTLNVPNASSGRHMLNDVFVLGSFTVAGFFSLGSESNHYEDFEVQTTAGHAAVLASDMYGWAVTPKYQALMQTVPYSGGNGSNYVCRVRLFAERAPTGGTAPYAGGAGDSALVLEGTQSFMGENLYLNSAGGPHIWLRKGADQLSVDGLQEELLTGTAPVYGLYASAVVGQFTTLSSPLSSGSGNISTLPVNATTAPLPQGASITLTDNAGHTQTWTVGTGGAAQGVTSVPVTPQTPNFSYPATTSTVSLYTDRLAVNIDLNNASMYPIYGETGLNFAQLRMRGGWRVNVPSMPWQVDVDLADTADLPVVNRTAPYYVPKASVGYRARSGTLNNIGASLPWITPEMFGAKGNGIADDTAAVLAAAAAVTALRVQDRVYSTTGFRPGATLLMTGIYNLSTLSSSIIVSGNMDASRGSLLVPASYAGRVVQIGHETSGRFLYGAVATMPVIQKTGATSLVAGSVAVTIQNLYHSQVICSRQVFFETGVLVTGLGIGCVYNEINLGWTDFCKVSHALIPGTGGWVNQNYFKGGGISQSPNTLDGGLTTDVRRSGYRHVKIDGSGGVGTVNGNTFEAIDYEGVLSELYFDTKAASMNVWLGSCRFEQGATATATTLTTDTFNTTAHGLVVGDMVVFYSPVSPATGMVTTVPYYVSVVVDANNFKVSETRGGATVSFATNGSGLVFYMPPRIQFDATGTPSQAFGNRVKDGYYSYPGPLDVRSINTSGGLAPSLVEPANPQQGTVAGRNRIINGNFRTNQRGYVSGASLALNAYCFDRWKATTASTTVSFTAQPAGQQVFITAGSIAQVIDQTNIEPGTYTLSWRGSANGRVYNSGASAPSYAAGPITVDIDGTTSVVVEFQGGSTAGGLGQVQLERGTSQTAFERVLISVELEHCKRYFQRVGKTNPVVATLSSALSTGGAITVLPVNTTTVDIPAFASIILNDGAGHTQLWSTTSLAAAGSTSIAVSSQTPNFAYPINTPVQQPTRDPLGAFVCNSTTSAFGAYQAPVEFRAKPTLATTSPTTCRMNTGGTVVNPTVISLDPASTTRALRIDINVSSGFTAGSVAFFDTGDSGALLDFSAEL